MAIEMRKVVTEHAANGKPVVGTASGPPCGATP